MPPRPRTPPASHELTDEEIARQTPVWSHLTAEERASVAAFVRYAHARATARGAAGLETARSRRSGMGPPLHVLHRSDELFSVVDGRWRFRLGDRTVEVDAGGFVFVPHGDVHTFQTVGAAPADVLVLYTPAGPEGAFAAALRVPREEMTRERAFALGMEYDTEIVGPPLPPPD